MTNEETVLKLAEELARIKMITAQISMEELAKILNITRGGLYHRMQKELNK